MQTLNRLEKNKLSRITCLFADIDDTISTQGHLTAQAYSAMERWQAAGKMLIPVTGRPAGWCDHIARMWPVDAIVGENGAFYFRYDRQEKCLLQKFLLDADTRAENRSKMQMIGQKILKEVPGAALASDQNYRQADLAIDFCEDVRALDSEAVDKIIEIMHAGGMTAKISSIHVNGWFGDYDKLSMCKQLMKEQFNIDIEREEANYAFIGDSPNDSPMFGFFSNSIGVRNLQDSIDRVEHKPTYITVGQGGAGFAELIDHLLA